uniref:DDE_Tnp_1_7 domain-containing protein n=1 Tax=Glossina austeni TaxID=7395 RepID=A0A1A9UFG4_GLOAU
MKHVRVRAEEKGRRILRNDWSVSLTETRAFIGILYGRGVNEAKNFKSVYLWLTNVGSREDRRRTERSKRLRTDKFALSPKTWNKLIEKSQAGYKPSQNITVDEQLFRSKATDRLTRFMPNESNKFSIKFWLASDVSSKYVLSGFPYLGKYEQRPSSMLLSRYWLSKEL